MSNNILVLQYVFLLTSTRFHDTRKCITQLLFNCAGVHKSAALCTDNLKLKSLILTNMVAFFQIFQCYTYGIAILE